MILDHTPEFKKEDDLMSVRQSAGSGVFPKKPSLSSPKIHHKSYFRDDRREESKAPSSGNINGHRSHMMPDSFGRRRENQSLDIKLS